MGTQIIVIVVMLLAFAFLAFMLYRSIKKHEIAQKSMKKKKGRFKTMPINRDPGRKR